MEELSVQAVGFRIQDLGVKGKGAGLSVQGSKSGEWGTAELSFSGVGCR